MHAGPTFAWFLVLSPFHSDGPFFCQCAASKMSLNSWTSTKSHTFFIILRHCRCRCCCFFRFFFVSRFRRIFDSIRESSALDASSIDQNAQYVLIVCLRCVDIFSAHSFAKLPFKCCISFGFCVQTH